MSIKDNMLKYRVMETHVGLVRHGKYAEARLMLRLLNNGYIRCGLDDTACAVETKLELLGCTVRYSRNYNIATIYMIAGKRREWK